MKLKFKTLEKNGWMSIPPCECMGGHEPFYLPSELEVSMDVDWLARTLGQGKHGESDVAAEDVELQESTPHLAVMLMATPVIEGKRRIVCTLTVVYEDGLCKAGLRERSINGSLWVSAPSMREALIALEHALGQVPVPWRIQKQEWRARGKS